MFGFGYCIVVSGDDANQTSHCRYLSFPLLLLLHHRRVRRLCQKPRRELSNIGKFRCGFRKCISIKLGAIRCTMRTRCSRVNRWAEQPRRKKKYAKKRKSKLYFTKERHPAPASYCGRHAFLFCSCQTHTLHIVAVVARWWLGLWCHNGNATWPTAVATTAAQCFRYDLNRVQIKLKPKRKTFSLNENSKNFACERELWRRQWQQAKVAIATASVPAFIWNNLSWFILRPWFVWIVEWLATETEW